MIKSNIPILMAKKGVRTLKEVCEKTQLSKATMIKLYYGKGDRVRFETLEKLCAYFECDIGDILQLKADLPVTTAVR